MDNPASDLALAARLKDESLRPFVGFLNRESYLSDGQLELLAIYRSIAAEDDKDSDTFAKNYVMSAPSRELQDDLAKPAPTPNARSFTTSLNLAAILLL